MATITINPNVVLGATLQSLDFSSVYGADYYDYGSTVFRAYYGQVTDEFRGYGFTYDSWGVPTGGTMTAYAGYYQGIRAAVIDGVKIAVTDIVRVAGTYSLADDMALVKKALAGSDKFTGAKGGDKLWGYAGNDTMIGNGGNDSLYGGTGNDRIYGGAGHDYLRGEAGSDTFVYKSSKDSTVGSTGRDTIYDFDGARGDKIDLSAMDASTKASGNQAFSFVGTKAFSGKAGELRYEKQSSDTYIYGDVNGDRKADFAIHLDDALTLAKGYVVL